MSEEKVRVKLSATFAHAEGSGVPGDELELSPAVAQSLIDGGYAESLEQESVEKEPEKVEGNEKKPAKGKK